MEEGSYTIKEAAKQVQVAEHVLRYWEEELGITIERNAQGCRRYTGKDLVVFASVKGWKEQGLQLKAIRKILVAESGENGVQLRTDAIEETVSIWKTENSGLPADAVSGNFQEQGSRAARLQLLLEELVTRAVRENNEMVLKELDYQFRQFEENAQGRELRQIERDEEHFRKLDALLCLKGRKKEKKRWRKG